MLGYLLRWIATLALAFVAGKLMAKIKMPSILGWLIVGMLLGLMPSGWCLRNCWMPMGIKPSLCGCNVLLA